jgi:hypothetical protein
MSDHDNKQEPDVVVGTDLTVAEVELAQDTKRDKKILFKIDIVVLTLVTLRTDTDLVGQQYSWLGR